MGETIEPGQKYGKLTVQKFVGKLENDPYRIKYWECLCECGKTTLCKASVLYRGIKKSCGCARGCRPKHGMSFSPEYRAWSKAKERCFNPANPDWKDYGGRGITMCERWRNSFENFLADVGPKPSPKHSIDRYPDNNGNYEPGNCRWATAHEQRINQRKARRHGQNNLAAYNAARKNEN